MTTETSAQDEPKKIGEQLDSEAPGAPAVESESIEETAPQDAEVTAPAATTEEGKQAPAEDEDDPKVLRNKLAGMEAIINQLSGRLRNAEGHIGGLNSQVKSQIEAARKVEAAGAQAPSAREINAAQGSPEALAELERDHPEFAKAMRPAIDAALSSRIAEFEKRTPQPSNSEPSLSRQELDAFKAELKVETRHPGWQEKVAGAEFVGWLSNSPREMKMLAASTEPADAIRLLDLYEDSKKVAPSKTSQRLSSAAALPTGQRTQVRAKNVDEMSPQEYWRYLDQLDKSKA